MADLIVRLLRDGGATAAFGANSAIRFASDTIQQTLSYTPETLVTMLNKLAVALAAVLPLATAGTPPSLPTISTWGHAGSGCSVSSAVNLTGSGWGDLGFEFPDTFKGTSGAPAQSTKNCAVTLQGANAPAGWQVAVESVSISGHATIQPNQKVEYLLTTSWAGEQATGVSTAVSKLLT